MDEKMKLIHWTPKEHKDQILEKGLLISDTWVSCAILTPFEKLNRWWLDFLLKDKNYVGIIFELQEHDFPLVHSHWSIDTHTEYDDDFEVISKRRYTLNELQSSNPNTVFDNIESLKQDYQQTILWRIGNTVDDSDYLDNNGVYQSDDKKIIASGLDLIKSNPEKARLDFFDNPDFMEFVFEDYEILLFKPVSSKRIETIIQANEHYPYPELMDELKAQYNLV